MMGINGGYKMAREIMDANFEEEVLSSSNTVVVDFWANWCGPCKMLTPIIEELSQDLGDAVKIVKVDVDKNPNIAMNYRISSIPTVMIFKEGKVVDTLVGFRPKSQLEQIIKSHI